MLDEIEFYRLNYWHNLDNKWYCGILMFGALSVCLSMNRVRAGMLGWMPWTYRMYPDLVSLPPILPAKQQAWPPLLFRYKIDITSERKLLVPSMLLSVSSLPVLVFEEVVFCLSVYLSVCFGLPLFLFFLCARFFFCQISFGNLVNAFATSDFLTNCDFDLLKNKIEFLIRYPIIVFWIWLSVSQSF